MNPKSSPARPRITRKLFGGRPFGTSVRGYDQNILALKYYHEDPFDGDQSNESRARFAAGRAGVAAVDARR